MFNYRRYAPDLTCDHFYNWLDRSPIAPTAARSAAVQAESLISHVLRRVWASSTALAHNLVDSLNHLFVRRSAS